MNPNNLESKVVSLELAKRMAKLGWEKETIYEWCINREGEGFVRVKNSFKVAGIVKYLPASLFCEVWDELHYEAKGVYDLMVIKNCKNETILYYYDERTHSRIRKPGEAPFHNINPAEAAGEMWIWIKENGHIKEV